MGIQCNYKGRAGRYVRCTQLHSLVDNKARFRGIFGVHAQPPVRRTQNEIDEHFKKTKMLLPAFQICLPESEVIVDFDHVEGRDIYKEAYAAFCAQAGADITDSVEVDNK